VAVHIAKGEALAPTAGEVPMLVDEFKRAAQNLTGTPVKDVQQIDYQCLREILADDGRPIDCSQFNELLLLVNKDRIERPFFDHFFTEQCKVGSILAGVETFQKAAMLRYGNFIYAFRTLAHLKRPGDFRRELQIREPTPFHARAERLIDIEPIHRTDTPLVGYLSPAQIIKDGELCRFLLDTLEARDYGDEWKEFERDIEQHARREELQSLCSIIENFRAQTQGSPGAFKGFLESSLLKLKENEERLSLVRAKARQNQDVYLTWDHMDVYFATSMRKAWEYEDLFDFISSLMRAQDLADLDLRYFDPTQCYMENRVDKGLVESLMLKRAECTVYSVQDTDTLGKDSELAATLAQGKTVVAYVPKIEVDDRTAELVKADPLTISERLKFVLYADERLSRELTEEEYEFIRDFQGLDDYVQNCIWLSLPDALAIKDLRTKYGAELERLCRIIAESERRIYDRRAKTLIETHPLAIQISLQSGVANGVLVVRTIPDCAKLLRKVLDGSMEFRLEEKPEMWYLREEISGCAYRVVTRNRKLTNCFWNFYLRDESNRVGGQR
jgi:hypothetical protein